MTNVPLTSPGVVNTSPPGKFPHFSGLISPLVFSHRYLGLKSAVRSVPAAVFARICLATRTRSATFALRRSTLRKSARIPSSMICRLMFTMCACRIFSRFTTSVICMRDFNSLVCACTAKMLTWLVSRSSTIGSGKSVSGRAATSSSTQELWRQPTASSSCTSAAAISSVISSVMTVTFSDGCTRRHTCTAFRAPGVSSGSNANWFSCRWGCVSVVFIHESDGSGCGDIVHCLAQANLGLLNDVIHHSFHVAGLAIHVQLPVRARAHLHVLAHVLYFLPRSQFVEHVIDKFQILFNKFALRNFRLFTEVDQLPINSIPRCPPLVFHQERP